MSKTLRNAVLTALGILLALALLVFGGNRLVYHRSLNATVFEWELRRNGRDSMTQGEEHWLKVRTDVNKRPIRLPEELETPYQHFTYGEDGMECYLFIPENYDPDRLAVYFCGGTHIDLPGSLHWRFIDRLSRDTGVRVLVPVYPKLPDYTAEEACDILSGFCADCVENMDAETVFFMGDSAGGGMALALAQTLAAEGQNEPDRLILISPWLDVSMENDDMIPYESKDPKLDRETLRFAGSLWAGDGSVTEAPASPLYGELSGLGPITLYIGTRELLYPDAVRFAELAEDAGCELRLVTGKGMNHVWPLFHVYGLKEAEQALQDIEQVILSN